MGITALERVPQGDCRICAFGILEDMARQNHNEC